MVQKCGYLPLAICLLGGVLREKKSIVEWESVNEHIKAAIYGVEEQIDGVLNLSYESLPYYLKPCFLLMGIFNEDETIDAWDLYNMWIAQGMISYENIGDKEDTLTNMAELYLSELASRSMVQVEFLYDYYVNLEYKGGKLSTLLRESSSHMKIQHLAIDFRSEVEHEPTVACGEDAWEHIRCLRLEQCELDDLPSSMRNLVYMDTLDLTGSANVEVPNVFKEMLRLKHLLLPIHTNENIRNYRLRLDEGVNELETLLFFDSRCHELKRMDRMKNLRHFVARVHDNESLSAIMNGIMNWNKIQECQVIIEGSCDLTSERMLEKALTCPNLYSLHIGSVSVKAIAKCEGDLLRSKLKCLYLLGCAIEDDPMGIHGKLPCLIQLRLYRKSFVGEEMRCPANSFLRLKMLVLSGLPKLREWRVDSGAMPLLSDLTIGECSCLEMVPEGLTVISTLQTLVIEGMPELRERVSPAGQDFHKVSHVPTIRFKY
ncbi:disease resistance RPP8-like protein 3 [Salvia hispanica]|uniref:disease resistance RPP8-like protein 3 n=1 Tax=Salvia hispanica TaxID=49212 RepID=UPI002009966B|nr:disease resistance RPP8-like protein 3 [Salvia hispanica]